MQRQRSILSFFQKPSPDNHGSSDAGVKPRAGGFRQHSASAREIPAVAGEPAPSVSKPDLSLEAFDTDTPPEKAPRRVLSRTDLTPPSDRKRPSLFSSIMHKFVRDDEREKCPKRFLVDDNPSIVCSMSNKFINCKETSEVDVVASKPLGKLNSSDINSNIHQHYPVINIDENTLGPETPSERPLIPRFKRVQEDCNKTEDKSDCSVKDSHKRVKFLHEPKVENKHPNKDLESASKFEWLDPSHIRDAKRRRPDDPLYDKRTLYIPPDVMKKMSASQKQYWSVKCQYMDIVLFFKVGKFYELYELDAEIGHKELDWKMTYSGVGKCRQVGVSELGIDDTVQKLVARGYKVGRIEQLETSEQAKSRGTNSVIQRKLINVITPSTTVDENISPDAVHLLAIKEGSSGFECGSTTLGFAFVDCAALKIWVGSVTDDPSYAALGALLMQVSPKEIIYEHRGLSKEAEKAIKKYSLTGSSATQITQVQPSKGFQDAKEVQNEIQSNQYFKGSVKLWDQFLDGVAQHEIALSSLGGLIDNLSRLMMDDVLRNGDVLPYQVYKGCLRMDGQTLVNLEIFTNNADGGPAGTLFKYLDNCITPSAKRLLRSWICHPMKDVSGITYRLDVVEALIKKPEVMLIVAQHLRKIPDLERLLGRVQASIQSSGTLLLPLVGNKTLKQRVKVFGSLVKGLRLAVNLLTLFQKEPIMSLLSKIVEIPVLGGRHGLDEFLTQFEAAIDSDFPRYQDHNVMESDAETLSVLIELFVERTSEWSQVLYAMNCIDVLRSFAIIANESSGPMCRPVMYPLSEVASKTKQNKGPTLHINGLWHPFALGENGAPVPNDLSLGGKDEHTPHTLLLTGPNMGGKSTLLRAACLAVIMAQLGCYVPCKECALSLVDTIFTRLGATDRIMTGESTFYIECAETASVLRNATQDSLVLLDELGRGTSTHDGYAIAYATFRHLVEKVNCRLLFATHYHPLTKEFASHPHVTLQHMACTFKSGRDHNVNELVFLYRLASGACPESYGLQVALMAGIPNQVVEAASRAGHVMKQTIGESFRVSEKRSDFSTLHEVWLKTLASVSSCGDDAFNEDTYDTLFCLWHELKSSYASTV